MKRLTALLLCALLLLSACAADANPSDTTADTTAAETVPVPAEFAIIENGQSAFTIVRSDRANDAIVKSATTLYKKLAKATGVSLALGTDFWREGASTVLDPDAPEILVGETNRPETEAVLAALPAHSYTVTQKNNKLVIVGADDDLTALALIEFESRILKNADLCGDGRLVLREGDAFTVTREGPLTMKEKITGKYDLLCLSEKILDSERVGDCYVAQGACSDGTYAYFVLRNADDTGAVINKHRLEDGERVAVSEVMKLGHGNDMTYDTKRGHLVVCTDDNTIATVDPDTLTIIERRSIAKMTSGMTYSEKRDWYAVSKGGKSLDFFDGEWKFQTGIARSDNTGYVVQGMGSDEDYIYFIMSGQNGNKDNRLVVYTWAGGYVDTLEVPVQHEGESMFWVNGKYYIAYHRAGLGPTLYETHFAVVYA